MKRFLIVILMVMIISTAAAAQETSSHTAEHIAQMSQVYELAGHTDTIYDTDLNRSSGRLASVSYDGTARLWDVYSGESLQVITVTGESCAASDGICRLTSVALSPDDRQMVVGSIYGYVWVYDTTSGEPLAGFQAHGLDGQYQWVNDITFAPDGSEFTTAGDDGMAITWDATTYAELTRRYHQAPLHALSYSPNGSVLASASGDYLDEQLDNSIVVSSTHSADSNPALVTIQGHIYPVNAVAFSPDGSLLASGDGHEFAQFPAVNVWDAAGSPIATINVNRDLGMSEIAALEFTPDGSTLAVGMMQGNVMFFNTTDLSALLTGDAAFFTLASENGVNDMGFTADGTRFVMVGYGTTIRVYGLE